MTFCFAWFIAFSIAVLMFSNASCTLVFASLTFDSMVVLISWNLLVTVASIDATFSAIAVLISSHFSAIAVATSIVFALISSQCLTQRTMAAISAPTAATTSVIGEVIKAITVPNAVPATVASVIPDVASACAILYAINAVVSVPIPTARRATAVSCSVSHVITSDAFVTISTAIGKTLPPIIAAKSAHACFKLPVWFAHVPDSLDACPNAPDNAFASSTICKSASCFCASDSSLKDFPYSLFAAVFLVVSVQERPSAESFS